MPIYNHVKHLISDYQHRFSVGYQQPLTFFVLLYLLHPRSIRRHSRFIIYIDLLKIFDKLDHNLLLLSLFFVDFSVNLTLF